MKVQGKVCTQVEIVSLKHVLNPILHHNDNVVRAALVHTHRVYELKSILIVTACFGVRFCFERRKVF